MKSTIRIALTIIVITVTSGCTFVVGRNQVNPINPPGPISNYKSFYVPVAHDGQTLTWPLQKPDAAPKSGLSASSILYEKVRSIQPRTVMGVAAETEREALESARQKGLDYVVYPKVNLWVDPVYLACAPEYADRAEVELSVYDVKAGNTVTLDRLVSGGCPINFLYIPIGTTTPEGRFRKVLELWTQDRLSLAN